MAAMPERSVGAVICDPPYGIEFMGESWDRIDGHRAWFEAAHRVLQPGGIIKTFGATRTFHRFAAAMETVGFSHVGLEAWGYGSGFPKSLNVSKALDRRGGNNHLVGPVGEALRQARLSRGWSAWKADQHFCAGSTNWWWFEGRPQGQRYPSQELLEKIAAEWPELVPLAEQLKAAEREVVGKNPNIQRAARMVESTGGGNIAWGAGSLNDDVTVPSTQAAVLWAGWGTALKPAWEPVLVGTKPLGTVPHHPGVP
jgi:hypothetical protein